MNALRQAAGHNRAELVATNLRYGRAAATLRVRAYAQIVVKVFLSQAREALLKPESIREACRKLIGGGVPTRQSVLEALDFLAAPEQTVVEQVRSRYRLKGEHWDTLNEQVRQRRVRVEGVLRRHFHGLDVDQDALRTWFDAAGAAFFSAFGDRWIAAVAGSSEIRLPPIRVRELGVEEALRSGFSEEEAALLGFQFAGFVTSRDPSDTEMLWHFGRAMLAARLVVADLGRDPIAAEEFRGAVLLLDTNVLLDLALGLVEDSGEVAGLGRAFGHMGAKPYFIHPTLAEYRAVIGNWRAVTITQLDKHGFDVVRAATDEHIQAAVATGNVRKDEFVSFYERLYNPPGTLEDVPLPQLDDPETADVAARGAVDPSLISQIQTIWT